MYLFVVTLELLLADTISFKLRHKVYECFVPCVDLIAEVDLQGTTNYICNYTGHVQYLCTGFTKITCTR